MCSREWTSRLGVNEPRMVCKFFGIWALVGFKRKHRQQEVCQPFRLGCLQSVFLLKELLQAPILETSEWIAYKKKQKKQTKKAV